MLKRAALYSGLLLATAGVLYTLVFKNLYYHSPALERSSETNEWFQNGFSVALVWPDHLEPSLVAGVTLALDEVNAGGGPLAGKIRLERFREIDDHGAIARTVVTHPDIVAVIGHEIADGTIPASVTYDRHGVLFFGPKSTDTRLTKHKFPYVFRLTPDDRHVTSALADFAVQHKWTRLVVLYGRADHGDLASHEFLERAVKRNLSTFFVRSYFHERDWERQDFRPLLSEVRAQSFDAIMLADELPWGAKILADMQVMGVSQPVLGTDELDSPDVWSLAKEAANRLYVASAVDPDSNVPAFVAFRQRFRQRFKVDPGYGASQGYEAFMLFVNAVLLSKSADPVVVATTLRSNKWNGLFGEVAFNSAGDIVGRDITIKHMQNGRFQTVEVMEEPADVAAEEKSQ